MQPAAGASSLQQQMRNMALANHQVEVLFVICGMLNGRRRAEMQDRTYACGGLKVLKDCIHRSTWECKSHGPRQRIHGPECVACSMPLG